MKWKNLLESSIKNVSESLDLDLSCIITEKKKKKGLFMWFLAICMTRSSDPGNASSYITKEINRCSYNQYMKTLSGCPIILGILQPSAD